MKVKKYINGLKFLFLNYVGYIPSHTLRKCIYRAMGMKIGKNSYIYSGAEVRAPENIEIGNNVIIGHHAILDGRSGILIKDNVNLSTGVWIWTLQHDPQSVDFGTYGGPVVVEEYAWLSARTVILPNLTVGRGTVIAASGVLTKSTDEYSIYGGVPARKIGIRSNNLSYKLGEGGCTPFI